MATINILSAPAPHRGKRSRSNSSSSSSTSSSANGSTGSSVFSRFTGTGSSGSLSSCSSPATASNETSPYTSGQEDGRPSKTHKTCTSDVSDARPCSLAPGLGRVADTESIALAPCGKTFFVDCLVDAAVHVLNLIWKAPLDKTIAFVSSGAPTSKPLSADSDTACKCPSMSRPLGPIPLDLFVRETLRRSRTSCSTLQTALLFCKRAGGEVVRRRAQKEGYNLTSDQLDRLPGADETYLSLLPFDSNNANDPILCSRRVFLASVMISSKFLQDRTFSNRAWAKISGLEVKELSQVERRLLMALKFDLNVREEDWRSWTDFLKGEWRVGQPTARCGLQHSLSQPMISNSTRVALARTGSLPQSNAFISMDASEGDSSPSANQEGISTTRIGEESNACKEAEADVNVATPKVAEHLCGETTPKVLGSVIANTKSTESRRSTQAQSLLIAAVYNHMQISSVQS